MTSLFEGIAEAMEGVTEMMNVERRMMKTTPLKVTNVMNQRKILPVPNAFATIPVKTKTAKRKSTARKAAAEKTSRV